MTLPQASLDMLCPMFLHLDQTGGVHSAGPTLRKLLPARAFAAQGFQNVFEVLRPGEVTSYAELKALVGRKMKVRLHNDRRTVLKGVAVRDGEGGLLLNFCFGINVVDAVRNYTLTSTDFAVTDLAIDMLYVVEAKSVAMEASRTLNRRLQGAMLAAEQRAFTDTLTGLSNRRAMDQGLTRLLRSHTPFALMHIDLDFFKQVNDTYGHAAGDRVLQMVAQAMLSITRKGDLVARVGGDEFVVILEGLTDRARLGELATRLIHRVEQPVSVDGKDCQVSASIGIAIGGQRGGTGADLLEQADVALYAAKRNGRSQYAFDGSGEGAAPA